MKILCFLFPFILLIIALTPISAISAGQDKASEEVGYFAMFMQDKKVGHAVHNRTISNGKVTTTEQVSMTLSRTGIPVTVNTTEKTFETIDGKPLGFETELLLGAMKMKTVGKIDEQNLLHITQTSMGIQQENTQQWPEDAVMAEGLLLISKAKGLEQGTAYEVKVFMPSLMQSLNAHVSVGPSANVDLLGRVVPLTEIKTSLSMPLAGPMKITEYVDNDFRTQKTITPAMGMYVEMVACTKEFALSKNDVLDVIDNMFHASPIPLNDLESVESIKYYLVPEGDTELIIPSTDNQQVEQLGDGSVILTVEPVIAKKETTFPYDGNDAEILEALEPTQFVQSDHPKIIELAKQAVGDTKDAAEAAKKIEAFVGDYVEDRSLSIGYASAAEVAASRQGDCTEFSVLTAAMCRAVGIPAHVVMGMAYVSHFAGYENSFGGHAWVQAYIGGKWVGLDSSFRGAGRGGFDASHIALAVGNGDPEDFFNLIATMGKFKIERIVVNRK